MALLRYRQVPGRRTHFWQLYYAQPPRVISAAVARHEAAGQQYRRLDYFAMRADVLDIFKNVKTKRCAEASYTPLLRVRFSTAFHATGLAGHMAFPAAGQYGASGRIASSQGLCAARDIKQLFSTPCERAHQQAEKYFHT